MRAALLCIVALMCAPAVAVAQTPTAPTGVPAATATTPAPAATTPAPTATATTPAPTSTQVEINVPATGDDDSDPSPALVGVIVLLALLVIVGLIWAFVRVTAWEPASMPRLRHAVGEAGYRIGGAWAQLRDWFSPRWR